MILEDTAYRGFACPGAGLDEAFFGYVVVEHAKQTTEEFLRRYGGELEPDGGLVGFLQDWLFRDERWNTVWNIAFGDVYAALITERAYAADELLTRVALRLHECGRQGEWHVSLAQPARFRFDRWLLPETDALRVRATAGEVTIVTGTGGGRRTAAFLRAADGGWRSDGPADVPVLDAHGVRCRVLRTECLGTTAVTRLTRNGVFEHEHLDPDAELLLRTGRSALDLIAELATPYAAWVGRVVTDLLPLPLARPTTQHSGSDNLAPGLVSVSNQRARLPLAEMLVHEGTHHYFFLLNRLGPIDDGTDTAPYFSPFRNMDRPIRFIVMAYHAFANVLLFYRAALAHGLPVDEPSLFAPPAFVASLEERLATMERYLRTTAALTPIGRALWEPLADELRR